MAAKDYYGVLGVSRDVDDAELKRAYRNLARTHHPDKNPGDKKAEERFKEISEAYAVLSDPDKRAQYDRFGTVAGPGGVGDVGFGTIIEDLFEGFFGGGERGRRPRARRGDDLQYDLEISLDEAADGVETKLQIPRLETCETCAGSGQEPGLAPRPARTCRGQGQVRLLAGLPHGRASLPDMSRAGLGQSPPLQGLQRRGTPAEGEAAQSRHPGGH